MILEVGELGTYDNVRRASLLAMAAGGFIKTSTGSAPGGHPPGHARDARGDPGRSRGDRTQVGMKPAGGIRQSKQAVQYPFSSTRRSIEWLTPDLYRLGASTLNDVLQIRKEKTGNYQSPDYFTID